jgi:chromosome segregation ATPase
MKKKDLKNKLTEAVSLLRQAKTEIENNREDITNLKMLFYRQHILINSIQETYLIPDDFVEDLYQMIRDVV